MRYRIHNSLGGCLGRFEDLQKVANVIQPGQFSFDEQAGNCSPCIVYKRDDTTGGVLGLPGYGPFSAMRECRKILGVN